jgi:hypothetical protein
MKREVIHELKSVEIHMTEYYILISEELVSKEVK